MDHTDQRILEFLLEDGRATYGQIGDQVGLSAPAAKRRVDRLRERGTIRGFTALLDPAALGWTTEAYLYLYCTGTVSPEELRSYLQDVPEVVSAATVSGAADAILQLVAADTKHLERAIERIRDEPKVDHTESVIVLSRLLDRGRAR